MLFFLVNYFSGAYFYVMIAHLRGLFIFSIPINPNHSAYRNGFRTYG